MKQALMPESQGYVFHCLHNTRRNALIGAKNIRTGVNTKSPMFSLLMSRGLVLQMILSMFTSGESQEHEIIPQTLWNMAVLV